MTSLGGLFFNFKIYNNKMLLVNKNGIKTLFWAIEIIDGATCCIKAIQH